MVWSAVGYTELILPGMKRCLISRQIFLFQVDVTSTSICPTASSASAVWAEDRRLSQLSQNHSFTANSYLWLHGTEINSDKRITGAEDDWTERLASASRNSPISSLVWLSSSQTFSAVLSLLCIVYLLYSCYYFVVAP